MKAITQKTNSIVFDDGRKEFLINDDPNKIIRINTSDVGIINRADEAIKEINRIAKQYKDGIGKGSLEAMAACDKEIKKLIDFAFDYPVCEVMLGNASCLSTVEGEPLYLKITNTLIDVITPFLEEEKKKLEKNISKYKAQADKIKESIK